MVTREVLRKKSGVSGVFEVILMQEVELKDIDGNIKKAETFFSKRETSFVAENAYIARLEADIANVQARIEKLKAL